MTTNLLATLLVTLTTNTVEHWPQMSVDMLNSQPLGAFTDAMVGGQTHWIYPQMSVNDTNADTKTLETTVTTHELLSFRYLARDIEHELTNWVSQHYSVDMVRVRTNATAVVYTNRIYTETMVYAYPGNIGVRVTYPTNYFVPVRTNDFKAFSDQRLIQDQDGNVWHLNDGVTLIHPKEAELRK